LPASSSAEPSLAVLAGAQAEREAAGRPEPSDAAPARPAAEEAAEPSHEALDILDPVPVQQAPGAAGEPGGRLRLADDPADRATAALLGELAQQVRALKDMVAELTARPVRPLRFGFGAFYGFVLGLGLLALVAVGLTALAGFLFYPPALDLLEHIRDSVLGSR
jgi:hypothetical protein